MNQEPFAISSSRVVTPRGIAPAAVLVRDGRIVDTVPRAQVPDEYRVDDLGTFVVMPGLVDTHVHINEPGRTEWEGFETATKSAAAGGITTLIDMPLNSSPVTTTPDAFEKKLRASEGKLFVDCGFHAGLIPGNSDQLPALIDAGAMGVKAFLIHSGLDEFPNSTERDLHEAMPTIAREGLPLLVHAELATAHPVRQDSDSATYQKYLVSRPRQWEHDAIDVMIRLCRKYDCRTHIVHLSSADAVPALKKARDEGLPITVEACPHYLYFMAEEIPDGDARYKCTPPIRERENRERLWQALSDGIIDFVVSDHSPCPPEMKCLSSGDFHRAWGGIASLQLGLSIVWTECRRRGFGVEHLARWMCTNSAAFIGLGNRKGAIAPGFDADIVVWNPDQEFTVQGDGLFHRHNVTPYEGRTLSGTIQQTFVHGTCIFHNGMIAGRPAGHPLFNRSHEVTTESLREHDRHR